MKKIASLLSIVFLLCTCNEAKKNVLTDGMWLAELTAMDDEVLPFNFKVFTDSLGIKRLEIYNAEEIIEVDEIHIAGDSIRINFPVYEGYLTGVFTDNTIEGEFIKESLDRIVPFKATHGLSERFRNTNRPTFNVSGVWETDFMKDATETYKAKGIFMQSGDKVSGTFRTATGDYRYLDGVVSGDTLKVSAFDGAHAFVFNAKVTDSSLNGVFYSGNHSKELFTAKRNEGFELVSADSLTYIKEGYDKLAFSFPNAEGATVSLADERYKDKVVVVQIMGTWCPNCLDETKYYMSYLNDNPNTEIEFIALAFEYAKTKEGAFKSIQRLKDRIGVNYPILLAQYGSSDKVLAQQKLPMLNHVLSYPTSIFIDKKGDVRKIHTGFNGPATGEKYLEFKIKFEKFVAELLAE